MDFTRRLSNGGLLSLHISPSRTLRMRWADAAADGGLWVFAAELPMQQQQALSPVAAKGDVKSVSFSLRREGFF